MNKLKRQIIGCDVIIIFYSSKYKRISFASVVVVFSITKMRLIRDRSCRSLFESFAMFQTEQRWN